MDWAFFFSKWTGLKFVKFLKKNRLSFGFRKNQVRVGNMDATLVSRCLSEPESEAGLRSVKISELAQKLTEIATYFSNEVSISNSPNISLNFYHISRKKKIGSFSNISFA
jgi:hypothetical protein